MLAMEKGLLGLVDWLEIPHHFDMTRARAPGGLYEECSQTCAVKAAVYFLALAEALQRIAVETSTLILWARPEFLPVGSSSTRQAG
jgi:hypothetical protein